MCPLMARLKMWVIFSVFSQALWTSKFKFKLWVNHPFLESWESWTKPYEILGIHPSYANRGTMPWPVPVYIFACISLSALSSTGPIRHVRGRRYPPSDVTPECWASRRRQGQTDRLKCQASTPFPASFHLAKRESRLREPPAIILDIAPPYNPYLEP